MTSCPKAKERAPECALSTHGGHFDPGEPFVRADPFQAIQIGALEPPVAIGEFVPFVPGEAPWQLAGAEMPPERARLEGPPEEGGLEGGGGPGAGPGDGKGVPPDPGSSPG